MRFSGATDGGLESYRHALHELQCFIGDPVGSVDRAIAADPGFVMAHVLKGYLFGLATEREAMAVARSCHEAALPLGAAVVGTVSAKAQKGIVLPWQALTSQDGKPAVWLFDPASKAVTVTPISVLAYESGVFVVDKGLEAGQQVITAGGQLLSPGEVVEVAEAKP